MRIKCRFYGGPCDGAETLLADPIPATIRGRGPHEDLIAEIVGDAALLEGDNATYHLAGRDDGTAVYAVAINVPIPDDVNWDGVDELRPPGNLYDRPL